MASAPTPAPYPTEPLLSDRARTNIGAALDPRSFSALSSPSPSPSAYAPLPPRYKPPESTMSSSQSIADNPKEYNKWASAYSKRLGTASTVGTSRTALGPSPSDAHQQAHAARSLRQRVPSHPAAMPARPADLLQSRVFGLTADLREPSSTTTSGPALDDTNRMARMLGVHRPNFSVEIFSTSFDHRGYPVYSGRGTSVRGVVRMPATEGCDVMMTISAHTTSGSPAAVWQGTALAPWSTGGEKKVFEIKDRLVANYDLVRPRAAYAPKNEDLMEPPQISKDDLVLPIPFDVQLPLGKATRFIDGEMQAVPVALPPSFEISSKFAAQEKREIRLATKGKAKGPMAKELIEKVAQVAQQGGAARRRRHAHAALHLPRRAHADAAASVHPPLDHQPRRVCGARHDAGRSVVHPQVAGQVVRFAAQVVQEDRRHGAAHPQPARAAGALGAPHHARPASDRADAALADPHTRAQRNVNRTRLARRDADGRSDRDGRLARAVVGRVHRRTLHVVAADHARRRHRVDPNHAQPRVQADEAIHDVVAAARVLVAQGRLEHLWRTTPQHGAQLWQFGYGPHRRHDRSNICGRGCDSGSAQEAALGGRPGGGGRACAAAQLRLVRQPAWIATGLEPIARRDGADQHSGSGCQGGRRARSGGLAQGGGHHATQLPLPRPRGQVCAQGGSAAGEPVQQRRGRGEGAAQPRAGQRPQPRLLGRREHDGVDPHADAVYVAVGRRQQPSDDAAEHDVAVALWLAIARHGRSRTVGTRLDAADGQPQRVAAGRRHGQQQHAERRHGHLDARRKRRVGRHARGAGAALAAVGGSGGACAHGGCAVPECVPAACVAVCVAARRGPSDAVGVRLADVERGVGAHGLGQRPLDLGGVADAEQHLHVRVGPRPQDSVQDQQDDRRDVAGCACCARAQCVLAIAHGPLSHVLLRHATFNLQASLFVCTIVRGDSSRPCVPAVVDSSWRLCVSAVLPSLPSLLCVKARVDSAASMCLRAHASSPCTHLDPSASDAARMTRCLSLVTHCYGVLGFSCKHLSLCPGLRGDAMSARNRACMRRFPPRVYVCKAIPAIRQGLLLDDAENMDCPKECQVGRVHRLLLHMLGRESGCNPPIAKEMCDYRSRVPSSPQQQQQQAKAQCKAQPYKVGSPPHPSNARAHHHNPATRSSPPHNQHHCQPTPDHFKDAVPAHKAPPARSPLEARSDFHQLPVPVLPKRAPDRLQDARSQVRLSLSLAALRPAFQNA
ncbi:hypothetical protein L1887_59539 [Cichorium endivia]|nr:hypothetical protein L1887_59539 [Cichorium endivia]